jgi:membrane associated rhomboid family serine protease
MVGPISQEERSAAMTRLKIGVVLLVGASGGLIALHGGAGPLVLVAATVGGLVVGGLLMWYLSWIVR